MTVAELIAELQRMPNQSAPVCVRVDLAPDESPGPEWYDLPVDDARNEGPFASIRIRYG